MYDSAASPLELPFVAGRVPRQHFASLADTAARYNRILRESGLITAIQEHASEALPCQSTTLPSFFLRRAEYRGSDVRLDTGMLLHPERAPRFSVNPHLWHWKPVMAWRWQHCCHINVLELEACLKTLRWRLRSKEFFQVRFLHLLDSQVCLAVLVKGRSSSRRLNTILQKISALLLAGDLFGLYAYIKSEFNPDDAPSRLYGEASGHNHSSFKTAEANM